MKRRGFLQRMAGAAAAPVVAQLPQPSSAKPMVALQLDAVGLVDEGIEQVLDVLQERAGVNTLLLDVLWFSRGTTEAELGDDRNRGHGKRDPQSRFRGSSFGTIHPEHYRDVGVDPRQLMPEAKGPDLLQALMTAAHKRGMRAICLIKDFFPDKLPGVEKLVEQDFNGQRATTSCKRNPQYLNLVRGAAEDLIRSYDADAIMYMSERQGAFTDTLGLRFRGVARGLPGSRTCFCSFCQQAARERGIDYTRAKAGFEELAKFVAAGRASRRPVDGYYVTLWRLMLRHPELLAWEHLWHDGLRELYRTLYAKVKATRGGVLFGSHIWPNHYMNPILRAETDLAELAPYHDFIKVALYNNCGGPRFGSYIDSVSQTMWGDVPRAELLQLHYRLMNYDEAPYDRVREVGLKGDFVSRECKRAMESARGSRTLILAGVDVDIPVLSLDLGPYKASEVSKGSRKDVAAAVKMAFGAGVHGIVVSREYTEMSLENLSGVGDALRELGLKA